MMMTSTKLAVMKRMSCLNGESEMREMTSESDGGGDRAGRRSTASQKKFRKPQARMKMVLAMKSTSDHSMMAKAAIWMAATTAANRPSTVAVKPTRFFRKVKAVGIDDCRGISPDDSRTGVNSSAFPASLKDGGEMPAATGTSGNPNGGRGLIWPFSPPLGPPPHPLPPLPLPPPLVATAALVPPSAAKPPGHLLGWLNWLP